MVFETLTRLGGYIMLFSMIASLLQKLPVPRVVTLILTGMVEITNGLPCFRIRVCRSPFSMCWPWSIPPSADCPVSPDKFHDP